MVGDAAILVQGKRRRYNGPMTLARLLELCPPDHLVAPPTAWAATEIDDLAFDSRQAGPGTLFFALAGTHTDGHQFLDDVAARGCRAVAVSRVPEPPRADTVYAVVADPRFALSRYSAALFRNPSRELFVIGVTGTDGKSTTVSFIHQLLTLSGAKAGFFSTVEWSTGGSVHHNEGRQSTPEAPQVHKALRDMADTGCRFAVLESTSHGLSPKTNRLGDVAYAGAVFTNVTLEHLEFHGTVENYRADKARLFSALARGREGAFGVVNLDDPHHRLFIDAAGASPVHTYSLAGDADLTASVDERPDGLELVLRHRGRTAEARLGVPGRFNASNLLAALLAASAALSLDGRSTGPLDLAPLVSHLHAVKGRMVPVRRGQDFAVLVDYAHTPGAFEALLPAIKAVTTGRVIAVFGSGGERDREKRPLQGALAGRWADFVVLTDEDPRLEDPQRILDDIERGLKGKRAGFDYWKITPRREAVRHALSLARSGDTVLLLGKGHERSLVTADGPQPWDEEAVACELLDELLGAR
jgi:UDP-N-acetylmuramoyl-L-alanyl-D-glutamate--2,6-diaminopimelate ligase